ncbi:hypothetical protein [uncultured Draconibacterium sp.]|uniref:hypothetical protein n=1 Tax=uncultured Draconibacterium sp. TaxID=1573823 RepID=UPI0025D132F4|nr:hypothetical protein [uncultured Draconibacterium sp.]
MKTMKFFIALLTVCCLMVGSTYSQNKKDVYKVTVPVTDFNLDCIGLVDGVIDYSWTDFGNGKIQEKYKGVFYGADDTYYLSQVFNCNLSRWGMGISHNGTQTLTMSIVSESTGMVVGEYHHTIHGTEDANERLVVWFERGWFECY